MRSSRSVNVLHDKSRNKSIAFTRSERLRLRVQGLLPYAVATQAQLVSRVMESLRRLPRDIGRYMALSSLQAGVRDGIATLQVETWGHAWGYVDWEADASGDCDRYFNGA